MLINDTIFLLDESLESLKRITEVQRAMDDQETWKRQSAEEQRLRRRQLLNDSRQCNICVQLE